MITDCALNHIAARVPMSEPYGEWKGPAEAGPVMPFAGTPLRV
jgi:hypothetical protein